MSTLTQSEIKRHILYRILAYIAVLTTTYYVLCTTLARVKVQLPLNPELQLRLRFNVRYATVWNLVFQIAYCILSLICDVTTLLNIDTVVPKSIRKYRYKMFRAVNFPMSFAIATFFWPVYFYDRQLIFPPVTDLVISRMGNVFCHFMVLIFALWEAAVLPKNCHTECNKDLKLSASVILSYVVTTLYTGFVDIKSFPYDILNVTLGTVWFYVVLLTVPGLYCFGYFAQWWYRDLVWKYRGEESEKNK